MATKNNEKTFRELQEVDRLVGGLYQTDPTLKDTKFGYAYKRFTDKFYVPLLTELDEGLTKIRVEFALEDEKTKEILTDRTNPRGFKYNKHDLLKCMEAENKFIKSFQDKTIEVEPWVSAHIPKDLSDEAKEQLKGILIK